MAAGRRLLEEARARAAAAREWQVVRLVQDSLDYAQGAHHPVRRRGAVPAVPGRCPGRARP
ncbi:hypothetical protein LT493_32100 [Streptomyces tricolor]|nr:hypothetical protein [Streptomyces tricolor]